MSIKKKLAIKTLLGGILLNMIISTYYMPPKLFNYFYSYLQYINENIYSNEKVELLLNLSYIIYILSIPFGLILNIFFNFNSNTITGISLLMKIISIYLLICCATNKIFLFYLFTNSSSSGLCFLPILSELWKYYPKNKGLITGIFFIGKGMTDLFYEYISIEIIHPKKINIISFNTIYSNEINERYFYYLKKLMIFLCILSSIIQCLIYPYSIYIKYFTYKKNKFKEKMNKGLLKDFYILSSHYSNRNTIGSTKGSNNESWLSSNEKEKNTKVEIKEPFISLITSYPFMQLSFIYFLLMIFNAIDLSSINKIGLYNNFNEVFLSFAKIIWVLINILWNIILGYLLEKIKFKKILIISLIIQIFLISFFYFIIDNKYGFILFNLMSSIINSNNNIVIPYSFNVVFGHENGLLLYGISSIIINTFYIYRNYVYHIFVEKIYFFVFCLICTIFYMIALITLFLFEEKKHIYKKEEENQEIMFNDLSYGQELEDIDICDIKEFKNHNDYENKVY